VLKSIDNIFKQNFFKSITVFYSIMHNGPAGFETKGLVNDFEKLYRKEKKPLFKRVVQELKKSRRLKKGVNISRINRFSIKDSNVLVLGKVLGTGELNHSVNIIAFSYSKEALEKLGKSKSKVQTLKDWAKKPVIPQKVILLG